MKFILISILWMSGLACTLSAQTTNPRYYCYDAAGVSAGFITGAGNAWMNGASFKQGLIQGGIGAAFGLGTGAVGGAAGGWFSTTPAGQKVGSWMGKHSKGRFFDRKNPNSPFSPIGKNTNVYVEDYTIEFPAYDDGVHQVPAQTYIVDVPEPDLEGMNLWPATKTSTSVLEGVVKYNYERFVSKIPANSKSSASFQLLDDGNYLFQAISPGKVPGSSALYQKWVNPHGEPLKC